MSSPLFATTLRVRATERAGAYLELELETGSAVYAPLTPEEALTLARDLQAAAAAVNAHEARSAGNPGTV